MRSDQSWMRETFSNALERQRSELRVVFLPTCWLRSGEDEQSLQLKSFDKLIFLSIGLQFRIYPKESLAYGLSKRKPTQQGLDPVWTLVWRPHRVSKSVSKRLRNHAGYKEYAEEL